MSAPPAVRYAGWLVAAEGALALIVAGVYLVHALTGTNRDVVRGLSVGGFGYGTAAWFALVGAGVLAAGWALITGRHWGRGVAVFTNLLLLGVAWYIRGADQPLYAGIVAALAIVTLGLLFSPAAVQWVSHRDDSV